MAIRSKHGSFVYLTCSIFLSILLLQSQAKADNPKESESILQALSFDGSLRFRQEFVDWPETLSSAHNRDYSFGHIKAQFGAAYHTDAARFYLQAQGFQLYDLPQNSAGPGSAYRTVNAKGASPGGVTLRQAYVDYKFNDQLGILLGRATYANGGEFELRSAGGLPPPSLHINSDIESTRYITALKRERIYNRMIGTFDYTAGRSFDSANVRLIAPEIAGLFLAFMNPTEGGFSADGNKTIYDIDIATAALQLPNLARNTDLQIFYYFYGDNRDVVKSDNRALTVRQNERKDISLHSAGMHGIKLFETPETRVHLLGWGVTQWGEWGEQTVCAGSFVLEAGVSLREVSLKPLLRVGFSYGSGDHDAEDDRHGTYFPILPTARQHAMAVFYNQMNNRDFFVQVDLHPTEKLAIKTLFHHLSIDSANDLIYSGGGASEAKGSFGYGGVSPHGRTLGVLPELQISYRVTPFVLLTAYAGHLFSSSSYREGGLTYGFGELQLSF